MSHRDIFGPYLMALLTSAPQFARPVVTSAPNRRASCGGFHDVPTAATAATGARGRDVLFKSGAANGLTW